MMRNKLMKCCSGCIALMAIVAFVASCAPSRPISIPQEWQVPAPPRPGAVTQPGPSSQQPVLKPAPQIRESNVAAGSEAAVAAGPETAGGAEPQRLASMHLVDQANASLAQGNADQAIVLLEQAIQVDVYNGEAFYGLARAWSMKGSLDKALEFASKAEILFQDEPAKLKELYLFDAGLFDQKGDAAKAQYYRQRAARL